MLDKNQGILNFDKSIILGQKQSIVKFRMFCKEDNVESVLATEITPVLNALKPSDGGVEFSGKITAKVLVREQNGTIGGMSYTVDLIDEYKDIAIKSDSIMTADTSIVEYDFQVEGAEVTVNAIIDTQFRIFARDELRFLEEGNLECRFDDIVYGTAVSTVDEVFSVSSQLELKDDIARVLSSQSNVVITSATNRDKIIYIEGRVILSLVYVPTGQENPQNILMPFDFSQEIAVEEDGAPILSVVAKSTKIRLEVFEDQKNSVFTVETIVGVSGVLMVTKEQKVISDCYSTISAISTQMITMESTIPNGMYCISSKIKDEIEIATEESWEFCGLFGSNITLLNTVAKTDGIETSGLINADVIFNTPNGFISQKLEYPFAIILEQKEINLGDIVELSGVLQGVNVNLLGQKINVEWDLFFVANVLRNRSFTFVSDLEEGENLSDNYGAIEISLAFAGDQLWDVAKNLNMSLDELTRLNPNLNDPLEVDQKLLVYHKVES